MKIFVTGAAGQVGQDLLRALAAGPDEVFASDITPKPDDPALTAIRWSRLDMTDQQAVLDCFNAIRPDRVYHLAGILSARGEQDPQLTYDVNQRGSYYVLEACRKAGVRQLIFTSSIAAYGPGLTNPVPEDVPTLPTTMYGVTKVATELLGAYYARRYGLDFRAVRFPGLISASLPGCGASDYALFMYVDAVRKGYYEMYCRPDTQIPLMYMPDGIRALLELADASADSLTRCVYNVAGLSPTAQQIADAVCQALPKATITFKVDPTRQAILDSWPQSLDDRAARGDWDWEPEYDLGRMTQHLIPAIRTVLEHRTDALDHD